MELVWPSRPYLASYTEAQRRGWSPNTLRPEAAREELEKIARTPDAFLAGLVDRHPQGARVTLPDGSSAERIPGYCRWMWEEEFLGSIFFRCLPGTTDLPPHCPGHIGYSTLALSQVLLEIRAEGLAFVELTTDPGNRPSQRVIEANGGVLVEKFICPAQFGGTEKLRFRIALR